MIKLNVSVASDAYSYGAGETVTLDKEFEQRLVDSGQAEFVKTEKKAAVKK